MSSEDQQVLRLRLAYLMRLLLILSFLLGVSLPIQARVGLQIHEMCLQASDY